VLLLRNRRSGQWGFPKGRRDPEDSHEVSTALREVAEETGYSRLALHPRFRAEIDYIVRQRNEEPFDKRVVYFLAEAPAGDPVLSALATRSSGGIIANSVDVTNADPPAPGPKLTVVFALATVLHAAIFMGLYQGLGLRDFGSPYRAVLEQALGNALVGVLAFQVVEMMPGAVERRRSRPRR